MTNTGKIIAGVAVGAVAIFALVTLVDVDVSGDLEVPKVELVGGNIDLPSIETSGGETPSVDVNTADVTVGEKELKVDVPTDVEVKTEERSISYPTIDIDTPEENKTAEEDDLN